MMVNKLSTWKIPPEKKIKYPTVNYEINFWIEKSQKPCIYILYEVLS